MPRNSLTPPRASHAGLVVFAMLFAGMWWWQWHAQQVREEPSIPYSTFFAKLNDGVVAAVTLRGQHVEGKFSTPQKIAARAVSVFRSMAPAEDKDLLPLLRAKGVQILVASEEQPFAVQLLFSLLPWVLIMAAWFWISQRARSAMAAGGPLAGILRAKPRKFDRELHVSVTFDDVAGLKAAKRDLQEIVQFLKEPAHFQRMGGRAPRGVLLVGPPGTGKTLLARAVAGESGVAFFSISASEFIEMFVGVGAARVRDLFAEAKKDAPAIVFIDEIDAVGRSRGAGLGGGNDEREQTLNQLLSEMDGFTRNDLTVVIAATNRPDVLDPALLRPGRFDRRVIVDRPEFAARVAILHVHTKGKPLADDVDLSGIAQNTPGFSGADLANLVNEAALNATRRSADAIEASDFSAAYDKIVLGDPREAKLDPKEKQRVAVHESGHAVVAHFSQDAEPLHRVTIIPRGMALGVTQQTPGADRHIMTHAELDTRLRVLMGGYAAENVVLGDVSTGAENDLKEATQLASNMVSHYGMSKKLGAVYYPHQELHAFLGQRIATDSGTSDLTIHIIESEARAVLASALKQAETLLAEHRTVLDRLVSTLIAHESLDKDELLALLGPPASRSDDTARQAPLDAVVTALS
jgi:cell division protease FtsH